MKGKATYQTARRSDASTLTGTGLWWHHQHDGSFFGWHPSWI